MVQQDLSGSGVKDMTAGFGERLVERPHCAYLRPVIVHANSPDCPVASKEYMFPFASVVKCAQKDMLSKIGSTLICTALTADPQFIDALTESIHVDRLNIGPVPTTRLNWLQPHEGNLTEFLYRSRAYQIAQ